MARFCIGTMTLAVTGCFAQGDKAPDLLSNVRVMKDMRAGATHEYRMHLSAGQYFELQVQQRGIDLALILARPDGSQAVEMDGPEGDHGLEILRYITDQDGDYHVRIISTTGNQPNGQYEIRLAEAQFPKPTDLRRVKAHQVYREAIRLFFERKPDSIRKSISLFESLLPEWKQTDDRYLYGTVESVLGAAYFQLEQWPDAARHLEASLEPLKQTGNMIGYATSRNYLGGMSQREGNLEAALEQFYEAYGVFRLSNNVGKASALNNVGLMLYSLGEEDRALQYFEEDLPLLQRINLPRGELLVRSNLSRIYSARGEYDKAEATLKPALALIGRATDKRGEGRVLTELGTILAHRGDLEGAWATQTKALETFREAEDHSGEGVAHTAMGEIRYLQKNYDEAEKLQRQALDLFQDSVDRPGTLGALTALARTQRERGAFDKARKTAKSAVAMAETLRTQVVSPDLRASYLGSLQQAYELDIDIALKLNQKAKDPSMVAAALESSERGHARTLLESLPDLRTKLMAGVDPQLLKKQRDLSGQIRKAADPANKKSAAEKRRDLEDLSAQYSLLQAEIRLKSPNYASITHYEPLSAAKTQELLDAGTQLIEFSLGEERSWAWLVSSSSLTPAELPAAAVIEAAASDLHQKLRTPTTNGEPAPGIEASAKKLSELILKPFAGQLTGKKIVIVPSGALSYVPFAALPDPGNSSGARLLTEHEIIVLPSVSALAAMREEKSKRKPARNNVAILADPIYHVGERRPESGTAAKPTPDVSNVTRAAADFGVGSGQLESLAYAEEEARNIWKLVQGPRSKLALNFDATRTLALSRELRDYRIVHFAAHAFADSLHPNLSGIVLSLVDRNGKSIDGFLRVLDIYNAEFNSDLVVLSACQTALGRNIRGEGVLGLTRSFMYAGVPRVVSSLWNVNDRSSSILMSRFYANLLVRKMRPAAALRAAQLSLAGEKRWRSPYYWAAFELQGEWQ